MTTTPPTMAPENSTRAANVLASRLNLVGIHARIPSGHNEHVVVIPLPGGRELQVFTPVGASGLGMAHLWAYAALSARGNRTWRPYSDPADTALSIVARHALQAAGLNI